MAWRLIGHSKHYSGNPFGSRSRLRGAGAVLIKDAGEVGLAGV